MPGNVNDIVRTLSAAQRKKVEARVAELIAEEMALQELSRKGAYVGTVMEPETNRPFRSRVKDRRSDEK